jgi:hypothetical protein
MMVFIEYKDGTSEYVPRPLLSGLLYIKRGQIKTYTYINKTASEVGYKGNWLKPGCILR